MVETATTIKSGNIIGSGSREFGRDHRLPPEIVSNQSSISQQKFPGNNLESAIVKNNDIDNLFTQRLTNMVRQISPKRILTEISSLHPENKINIWRQVEIALRLEKSEAKRAKMRSKSGRQLPKYECGRVRDLVACKTGFKSANSYIAAKTVYFNAHQDIKKIVEDNIIKLTPASKIAKLDTNIQIKAAAILRLIATNFKNSKRSVSRFVNNLLSNPKQDLDRLF
ncbi:hypothetical protein J7L67_00955, partial [bacterium]|nr:hypothetical protein [bacterium]